MSDEYADWDGAYVMGALSRAERLEYEAHLTTCAACTEAVAELGVLPGLLGRLDADSAELLIRPALAETDDLPVQTVTTSVPRQRPAIRWRPSPQGRWSSWATRRRIGLAVAAAAVVAAAVMVPLATRDHPAAPSVAVALHQVRPSPLSADVGLTAVSWGTRIDMTCSYARQYGEPGGQRPYALYVVDRSGRTHLVARWHAGPGQVARTTGSTDLPVAAIDAVQLRTGDGTLLLDARLPGTGLPVSG